MKLKIAICILMAAGPACLFAEDPAPGGAPAGAAPDPEIMAKAENAGSKITVLLVDTDTDGLAELQRKLGVLKAVQKEMGEETLLRLEIIEELRKTQYGLQALSLRPARYDGGKARKLAVLERIADIASSAAKETENSRNAKAGLSAFRAALGAFRAGNNGLFPENPAKQLVPEHLQSVPYIRLPGHGAETNSIQVLTGVRNSEELFQKVNDSGGWLYVGDRTSPIWGTLIFNCNHKDYNGTAMYRY